MVRGFRKKYSGIKPLKKLVYLISPKKIDNKFYIALGYKGEIIKKFFKKKKK